MNKQKLSIAVNCFRWALLVATVFYIGFVSFFVEDKTIVLKYIAAVMSISTIAMSVTVEERISDPRLIFKIVGILSAAILFVVAIHTGW